MRRRGWGTALVLAAGLAGRADAQPLPEPLAPLPPAAVEDPPPAPRPPKPARPRRFSVLDAPVAPASESAPPAPPREETPPKADPPLDYGSIPARPRPAVAPVPHELPAEPRAVRAASFGRPQTEDGDEVKPLSAARVEGGVRRAAAAVRRTEDPVIDFLSRRSDVSDRRKDDLDAGRDLDRRDDDEGRPRRRGAWKFGDRIRDAADGIAGGAKERFRSDHAFDGYISPVTNPFLFEDPRSLTEFRPIVIFQNVPGGQPEFRGGNITWYGAQARLAVTERFSFVFHKIGGITVNPDGVTPFDKQTGFSELWLGPKYTFIRNEDTCGVLAGGLQFQLPVGGKNVAQDTGSLSLVPYATYARPFFKGSALGTVNTMLGTGYSFSTTSARSDYYYLSAHADLNVRDLNRIYPLAELNWQYYTTNGNVRNMGSEGRDLINFGGHVKNTGILTGALGARFKISETAQIGAAYEIPLAGRKDFFDYRFTLDFILRY